MCSGFLHFAGSLPLADSPLHGLPALRQLSALRGLAARRGLSSLFRAVCSLFSNSLVTSLFRLVWSLFSNSLVRFERFAPFSVSFERFASLSQNLKSPSSGLLQTSN